METPRGADAASIRQLSPVNGNAISMVAVLSRVIRLLLCLSRRSQPMAPTTQERPRAITFKSSLPPFTPRAPVFGPSGSPVSPAKAKPPCSFSAPPDALRPSPPPPPLGHDQLPPPSPDFIEALPDLVPPPPPSFAGDPGFALP
ncbi:Disintegrin and metalloproteinase domain-containing protein 29 [Manis javanica]|nr:Disintegrin and metalloproteinase domain-containing protein 29 [Manis javanica]